MMTNGRNNALDKIAEAINILEAENGILMMI